MLLLTQSMLRRWQAGQTLIPAFAFAHSFSSTFFFFFFFKRHKPAEATSGGSIAIGAEADASGGDVPIAVGYKSVASGLQAIAIGAEGMFCSDIQETATLAHHFLSMKSATNQPSPMMMPPLPLDTRRNPSESSL